jgi:ArsR family transcriptional regulator, arsenate/arsenite/antimonite-responsive transcriptional repressor
MRDLLNIAKAVSDPARVRVLAALGPGELCLCHFIALLELSPSTVSKHLDILHQAGLVQRRKVGRWCYFRRAGREAGPAVRGALRWVETALAKSPETRADAARVARLRRADVKELACCYKGA